MKVIGSIIARLKRKQLPHKNLLPLGCKTILQFWIERPQPPKLVNDFVVSTENELIARAVAEVLRKLPELAQDDVSPIPVNFKCQFCFMSLRDYGS